MTDHISKSGYESIVKSMERDIQRSTRQREIERAHGQDMPALLRALDRKHEGNVSAMLRELNERVEGSNISRPTMYKWLGEYDIRE